MSDTIINSAIAFHAVLAHGSVSAVYSGRHGCACGCRGNHTSSPRSVSTVVTKMRKAVDSGEAVEIMVSPGVFAAVDTPTRTYVAYLDGRIS